MRLRCSVRADLLNFHESPVYGGLPVSTSTDPGHWRWHFGTIEVLPALMLKAGGYLEILRKRGNVGPSSGIAVPILWQALAVPNIAANLQMTAMQEMPEDGI
jgi:hypothetical protein